MLAHLITYEAYSLEAIAAWQRGESHWISAAMQSAAESRRVHYSGIEDRQHMTLDAILEQWETTRASLIHTLQTLSNAAWHEPAAYPVTEPTDLGGMLEAILVAPPRPLYRHLPVHVPDPAAYLQAVRQT